MAKGRDKGKKPEKKKGLDIKAKRKLKQAKQTRS